MAKKNKNKSTLTEYWLFLCFFIYHYFSTSLNCIGQKHTKQKSLNNKPIKTITEHLTEISSHKMHGVQKHTL